jgi:polyisoprenoid-binding protein YceI
MRRHSLLACSILVSSLFSAPVFADDYKVDGAHSTIVFNVVHLGFDRIFGLINEKSGTFTIDTNDASKSTFNFVAKIQSIDTGIPDRDKHLRSPDFFDAAEFPEISFKSTTVAKDGDNYKVTGKLTLHGVTKDIAIVIKKIGEGKTPSPMNDYRIGMETQFSIKRSDYGMGKFIPMVSDEVQRVCSFQGIKS